MKRTARPDRAARAIIVLSSAMLAVLFATAGCIVGAAIVTTRPRIAVAAAPPPLFLPLGRLHVRAADLAPAQPAVVDVVASNVNPLDEWMTVQPLPMPDWKAIELAETNPAPLATSYRPMIRDAALRRSLSPELVEAIARVESDFNPYEVSEKGALGLLQVMPETGARFGVTRERLFDPQSNLAAGTAYLAWLRDHYRGDLDLILAAYNAGEGAVDQHGGIPPYRETQQYVKRVRAAVRQLEAQARRVRS
jgi:soluble lytic murein transglycosylase-like protein